MVEDGRDLKKTPSLISTFYILLPSSTTHRIHVRYIDLHLLDVGKWVGKIFHSHWSITALGVMSSTRQLQWFVASSHTSWYRQHITYNPPNEGKGPISGILSGISPANWRDYMIYIPPFPTFWRGSNKTNIDFIEFPDPRLSAFMNSSNFSGRKVWYLLPNARKNPRRCL